MRSEKPQKINDNGLKLVKDSEGLRLDSYPDPATGGKPYTIGYGSTKGVVKGIHITIQDAERLLLQDLREAEDAVNNLVRVHLTGNEFSALVCFVFNVGVGNFRSSTLLKRLNNSEYQGVPFELSRWNKAAGRVMAGLTERRRKEGVMFATPDNKAVDYGEA